VWYWAIPNKLNWIEMLLLTVWSSCVASGLTAVHSMSSSPLSEGLAVYLQPKLTLPPSAWWMVCGPVDVTRIPRAHFHSGEIQMRTNNNPRNTLCCSYKSLVVILKETCYVFLSQLDFFFSFMEPPRFTMPMHPFLWISLICKLQQAHFRHIRNLWYWAI